MLWHSLTTCVVVFKVNANGSEAAQSEAAASQAAVPAAEPEATAVAEPESPYGAESEACAGAESEARAGAESEDPAAADNPPEVAILGPYTITELAQIGVFKKNWEVRATHNDESCLSMWIIIPYLLDVQSMHSYTASSYFVHVTAACILFLARMKMV